MLAILLRPPQLNPILSIRPFSVAGYDIFIVLGELPASQADQVLRLMPATQTVKPRLISDEAENAGAGGSQSIQEDDLQRALQASMQECGESEEEQLQAALAMSVQGELWAINLLRAKFSKGTKTYSYIVCSSSTLTWNM